MQTHKNPGLRGSASIPAKEKKSVSPPKYGASTAPQKPPKFGLEGKKWVVEFQRNNSGLVIEECEVNQSVYVYKCDGSTIQVKGKVNNIILDSCKKTAVVFKSVVSSCEFINCQSVQMQVTTHQDIDLFHIISIKKLPIIHISMIHCLFFRCWSLFQQYRLKKLMAVKCI